MIHEVKEGVREVGERPERDMKRRGGRDVHVWSRLEDKSE